MLPSCDWLSLIAALLRLVGALQAFYFDSNCAGGGSAVLLGEGFAHINLDIAAAALITVTASSTTLTTAADPAASAPILVPTTVTLTVVVSYADGSSRDLSLDSRVIFTTTSSLIQVRRLATIAGAFCALESRFRSGIQEQ